MLILSTKLTEIPVMSLQTGAKIADISDAIVDPSNLHVVAYKLSGSQLGDEDLLLTQDIREVSNIGMIIDSVDELVVQGDMVKLKELFELKFKLIGKTVIDDTKSKVGTVQDYGVDPIDFNIYQLHIKRPLIRSLQTSHAIVNRSQIIEINNKNVVVRSATEESQTPQKVQNFVNPFRKNISTSPEAKDLKAN